MNVYRVRQRGPGWRAAYAETLVKPEDLLARILKVLEESHGNMSRTAAILGIDRRSLYRMLARHKIPHRPAPEDASQD